jgi:hypothetical protein
MPRNGRWARGIIITQCGNWSRNRKLHVVLLEEFVADPIKWDDRPFVPKYAVSNGIGYMLGEDGVWRDEDGNAATLEII